MYPTAPIAATPKMQIFMDSHSSSLPGFLANFIILAAELRNDLSPKVTQPTNNNESSYKGFFKEVEGRLEETILNVSLGREI